MQPTGTVSHCSVVLGTDSVFDDHAAARPVRMVSLPKAVFYCALVSIAVGAMLVVQYRVLSTKHDDVRKWSGSQIAKWLASTTASAQTIKQLQSTVALLEVTACGVSIL